MAQPVDPQTGHMVQWRKHAQSSGKGKLMFQVIYEQTTTWPENGAFTVKPLR